MKNPVDSRVPARQAKPSGSPRTQKLALALRNNLARRKASAQARRKAGANNAK